jgi:hypothetical protein
MGLAMQPLPTLLRYHFSVLRNFLFGLVLVTSVVSMEIPQHP